MCIDAGFLRKVSWGRTVFHDKRHCRILTLHRFSGLSWEHSAKRWIKTSDPKGWVRVNTKMGPVSEVTTSYLQGKYEVEITLESVTKDNSHSWSRISRGLNKFVTDKSNKEYDDNEQETSEMQFEDFALETNVLAFSSRSKAKAKPRRREPAGPFTRTKSIGERNWTDFEPQIIQPSIIQCPSKWALSFIMVIYLEKMMQRLNSGDLKMIFETSFEQSQYWSDDMLKSKMAGSGGNKKDIEIELIHQHKENLLPSSSRSSRTQSHWSFITRQCIHSERFRVHLSHVQSICTPSWVQNWH